MALALQIIASGVTFPGASVAAAPHGSFVLRYTHEPTDAEPFHEVALIDEQAHQPIWRHQFPRHLSALWGPDGRTLAVTDALGSDLSNTYVIQTSPTLAVSDIQQALTN